MKKRVIIFLFTALLISLITIPALAISVQPVIIGPGALPAWHEKAQVQLGWIFNDPTRPDTAPPLPGWSKAIGDTIPVWNYNRDRMAFDQPAQWFIEIPNLINSNPVKRLWISWVYSFDRFIQGPRVFTNIDWEPFSGYSFIGSTEEWFKNDGTPTADHLQAAYARITMQIDLYPNPPFEKIWLGTKGTSMMALEVYVKTLCVAPCEGDFDGDGDVDVFDLGKFAADFGRTGCKTTPCKGDFDNDGDVDVFDLGVFAADFGRTDCPKPPAQ